MLARIYRATAQRIRAASRSMPQLQLRTCSIDRHHVQSLRFRSFCSSALSLVKDEDVDPRSHGVLHGPGESHFVSSSTDVTAEHTEGSGVVHKVVSMVERDLRRHFTLRMQNTDVPLLRDFDTYAASLPIRKIMSVDGDTYPSLYTFNFYVNDYDLKEMAERIIRKPVGGVVRTPVKYLAAPVGTGKTASVLPAFLASTAIKGKGGTYYLYIAFANNGEDKNFKKNGPLDPNPERAEKQGAAFMVDCVERLLTNAVALDGYEVPVQSDPPTTSKSLQRLRDLIQRYFPRGSRLWLHLDEHFDMCDRSTKENAVLGDRFSRGAMAVLAEQDTVTVIATHTERPLFLKPAVDSSGVCRSPVAIPPLDVFEVAKHVPALRLLTELKQQQPNLRPDVERLFLSLLHRMSLKMRYSSLVVSYSEYVQYWNEESTAFFHDFERIVRAHRAYLNDMDAVKKLLVELTNIAAVPFRDQPYEAEIDPNAANLLLTMRESKIDRTSEVAMIGDSPGRMAASIHRLMRMEDPEVDPYQAGKELYRAAMTNSADNLSHTPLEAAYIWTLACRAAVHGSIAISPTFSFQVKCTSLAPGRLFLPSDGDQFDLSNITMENIQRGVMYYVDAPKHSNHGSVRSGTATHPLCDIYFRTDQNQLVLVDVYGGSSLGIAETKAQNLENWIQYANNSSSSFPFKHKVYAIVLAPNIKELSRTNDVAKWASIVSGRGAQGLLGGLRQGMRFNC